MAGTIGLTRTRADGGRRVVVTGIGMVTPLGVTRDSSWQGVIEARSGAAPIAQFDASELPIRFACEVKDDFDPTVALDRKLARRTDRFVQFAVSEPFELRVDQDSPFSPIEPVRRIRKSKLLSFQKPFDLHAMGQELPCYLTRASPSSSG